MSDPDRRTDPLGERRAPVRSARNAVQVGLASAVAAAALSLTLGPALGLYEPPGNVLRLGLVAGAVAGLLGAVLGRLGASALAGCGCLVGMLAALLLGVAGTLFGWSILLVPFAVAITAHGLLTRWGRQEAALSKAARSLFGVALAAIVVAQLLGPLPVPARPVGMVIAAPDRLYIVTGGSLYVQEGRQWYRLPFPVRQSADRPRLAYVAGTDTLVWVNRQPGLWSGHGVMGAWALLDESASLSFENGLAVDEDTTYLLAPGSGSESKATTLRVTSLDRGTTAVHPVVVSGRPLQVEVSHAHVAVSAAEPGTVVVSGALGGRPVLLLSPDRGATWRELKLPALQKDAGKVCDLVPAFVHADPEVLAVAASAEQQGSRHRRQNALLLSSDLGASWEQRPLPGAPLESAELIAARPPDGAPILYLHEGRRPWLLVSTDLGRSWIKGNVRFMPPRRHAQDWFGLTADPGDGRIVYAYTCAGLYRSTNMGRTWRRVVVPQNVPERGVRRVSSLRGGWSNPYSPSVSDAPPPESVPPPTAEQFKILHGAPTDELLRRARDLGHSHQWQQVEKIAVAVAAARGSNDLQTICCRAWAAAGLGKRQKALDLYGKAVALDRQSVPALLGLARARGVMDQFEEAAQARKRASVLEPDNLKTQCCAGWLAGQQEDWRTSAAAYEKVTRDSKMESAYTGLARAYASLGRAAEAKAALDTARRIRPHNPDHSCCAGYLAMQRKDWAEAARDYAEGQRLGAWPPGAHRGLMSAYGHLGRVKEALQVNGKAIAVSPKEPTLYCCQGWLYELASRWREEEQSKRKALALGSKDPLAYLGLADALLHQARSREAVAAAERARALAPRHPRAHCCVGAGYARLGRWQEAAREFQTALDLQPNLKEATKYLTSVRGHRKAW